MIVTCHGRYHSLHHDDGKANFCLFLPLYDFLGGTLNPTVFKTHENLRKMGRCAFTSFDGVLSFNITRNSNLVFPVIRNIRYLMAMNGMS